MKIETWQARYTSCVTPIRTVLDYANATPESIGLPAAKTSVVLLELAIGYRAYIVVYVVSSIAVDTVQCPIISPTVGRPAIYQPIIPVELEAGGTPRAYLRIPIQPGTVHPNTNPTRELEPGRALHTHPLTRKLITNGRPTKRIRRQRVPREAASTFHRADHNGTAAHVHVGEDAGVVSEEEAFGASCAGVGDGGVDGAVGRVLGALRV